MTLPRRFRLYLPTSRTRLAPQVESRLTPRLVSRSRTFLVFTPCFRKRADLLRNYGSGRQGAWLRRRDAQFAA